MTLFPFFLVQNTTTIVLATNATPNATTIPTESFVFGDFGNSDSPEASAI